MKRGLETRVATRFMVRERLMPRDSSSTEGGCPGEPAQEDAQASLGRLNGAIVMQIGRPGQASGVGFGEQSGLVILGCDQDVDLGGHRSLLWLRHRVSFG